MIASSVFCRVSSCRREELESLNSSDSDFKTSSRLCASLDAWSRSPGADLQSLYVANNKDTTPIISPMENPKDIGEEGTIFGAKKTSICDLSVELISERVKAEEIS